jgi:hypothetical protein
LVVRERDTLSGIAPFLFWKWPSLRIEWNCRSLGSARDDKI